METRQLEMRTDFEVTLRNTRAGLVDTLRAADDALRIIEQAKRQPVRSKTRRTWGMFERKKA